jgi:hypothetical protein
MEAIVWEMGFSKDAGSNPSHCLSLQLGFKTFEHTRVVIQRQDDLMMSGRDI